MEHHPQLYPYIQKQDILPDHLRPTLDGYLDEVRAKWNRLQDSRGRLLDAINDRRSMIEALDREIKTFSQLEKRIRKQQNALNAHGKRYNGIVSAARRFTPKIIARILEEATGYGQNNIYHLTGMRDFLTLRQVSPIWRDVAYSTPSLWKSLALRMGRMAFDLRRDGPDSVLDENVNETITSWFARAGEHPFSLVVYAPTVEHIRNILDGVAACDTRFQSLTLDPSSPNVKGGPDTTDLLESLLGNEPLEDYSMLTTVVAHAGKPLPIAGLKVIFDHRKPPSSQVVDLDRSLPHLTDLVLQDTGRFNMRYDNKAITKFSLTLIHQNISVLVLLGFTLDAGDVHPMVSHLSLLKQLVLECSSSPKSKVENHPEVVPFIHQSLQHVVFLNNLPESFLDGLSCPILKTVELSQQSARMNRDIDYPDVGQALSCFIGRSTSPIKLQIDGRWPSQLVPNIMSNVPPIAKLTLDTFSLIQEKVRLPKSLNSIVVLTSGPPSEIRDFVVKQSLFAHGQQTMTLATRTSQIALNFEDKQGHEELDIKGGAEDVKGQGSNEFNARGENSKGKGRESSLDEKEAEVSDVADEVEDEDADEVEDYEGDGDEMDENEEDEDEVDEGALTPRADVLFEKTQKAFAAPDLSSVTHTPLQ